MTGRTTEGKVLLDRADVEALLRSYRTSKGVTAFYQGDPLIERVCAALEPESADPPLCWAASNDDVCRLPKPCPLHDLPQGPTRQSAEPKGQP